MDGPSSPSRPLGSPLVASGWPELARRPQEEKGGKEARDGGRGDGACVQDCIRFLLVAPDSSPRLHLHGMELKRRRRRQEGSLVNSLPPHKALI